MRTQCLLLFFFFLVIAGSSCFAQVPVPLVGYVEGPIRELTYNLDGSATMLVQNTTVSVPATLAVQSPTTTLTVRQLCLRNRLPGRVEPGFLGGTALINGVVDPQTLVFTATDVTVEPAENVVIGAITSVSPLQIQGTELAILTDPRITTQVHNIYGFPVRMENLAVGQPASAEGYFAANKLQCYVIELEPDAPLVTDVHQINILRAQSRERAPNNNRGDEVDMRGFYYTQDGVLPLIQVFRDDGGVLTSLGFATLVPDAVHPKFGVWDFRIITPPTLDPVLGTAPVRLHAVLTGTNGATASADIAPDLR
jgi:hypothetical protein